MDFTTLAMMSEYKVSVLNLGDMIMVVQIYTQVHFSLRGDDLVLRAQCNQTGGILELIPSSKLQEDLPAALVKRHVHWLNLTTKTIEIRSLEQPWKESSANWRIDCAFGQYRAKKGQDTLVDIHSPTWAMVSKCFECLNDSVDKTPNSQPNNLLITMSPINSPQSAPVPCLSVALLSYSLSFFVNEHGELESRDFKDMVYDENQSVGTLFGLENLLVLRQKTHFPEELIPRRVIVPSGLYQNRGDHRFRIDVNEFSTGPNQPLCHIYVVDTELGCLIGNGSLTGTQNLAHLHAMTSCHRPDPLTGKTGAQAALHLSQSARCRSIMKLKAFNGGSFPTSTYYPQIEAAQKEIRKRYYWNRNAYDREAVSVSEKREARRAAYLFPSNAAIGPNSPEDGADVDYLRAESDLELEDITFTAASAAYRLSINALTMSTILNWAELWSVDTRVDTASSPSPPDGRDVLSHPDLVQTLTIKVRGILEKTGRAGTRHQFQLLFVLPAMAYCSPCHQAAFLSLLVAFAKQLETHMDDPLIHADYRFWDGYRPTKEVLWDQIRRFRFWSLEDSVPEDDAVKLLLKDWPFRTPPTLKSLGSGCWDVAGLTDSLRQLFYSCYRNFNLREHLMRVLAEPGLPTLPRPISRYMFNERTPWQITLDGLLLNRPPPELTSRATFLRDIHKGNRASYDVPALDRLFSSTIGTESSFQREYIAQLNASAQRVREETRMTHTVTESNLIEALRKHYARCRVNYMDSLATLKRRLGPTTDPLEQALDRFGQWPPITADVLLRCLASTSPIDLPPRWKKCLISLALLLLELQRSRRLLRFALDGLEEEFSKELENEVCDGWNPEEYPDWLVIQVCI